MCFTILQFWSTFLHKNQDTTDHFITKTRKFPPSLRKITPKKTVPRKTANQKTDLGKLPPRKVSTEVLSLPWKTPRKMSSKENCSHERLPSEKLSLLETLPQKIFMTTFPENYPRETASGKGPLQELAVWKLTWWETVTQKLSSRPRKLILSKVSFGILKPTELLLKKNLSITFRK